MTHGEIGTLCLGGSLLTLGYLLLRTYLINREQKKYRLLVSPPPYSMKPSSPEAESHYVKAMRGIPFRPLIRPSQLPRNLRREDLSTAPGVPPELLDELTRGLDLVNNDHVDEGWIILQGTISRLEHAPLNGLDLAEFLLGIAITLKVKERYREAEPLYGKARLLLEIDGDPNSWLRACIDQGYCLRSLNRNEEALAMYLQAEQAAVNLSDHEALNVAWNNQGMILLEVGRFEEAAQLFWKVAKYRDLSGKYTELSEVYRNACLAFKRIGHDRAGDPAEKKRVISAYWLAIMFANLACEDCWEAQIRGHFRLAQFM